VAGHDFTRILSTRSGNLLADFRNRDDGSAIYYWFWEEIMRALRRYSVLLGKLARIYCSNRPGKAAAYRRTIFYAFKEWGGVYIKFLQIMAGMSKFMEGWAGPKEMSVFSQVPYEPLDITAEIDVGKFASVETEPFAAGSFALVYRGVLPNGKTVAIKVLRPSIRKNLQHDLATLRRLCWLFSRFLPDCLVDYNEAYAACAQMFKLETDYESEMANQAYFAELYRHQTQVVIPKVYPELSSAHVIVQEYIAGPTLAEVMSRATRDKTATALTQELTGSDLWQQVALAGGEALYTAMCADYVYGDPHPGNIVLLPENRIAFIDFGIIAEKPSSHRAFYEWVESYYEILRGEDKFKRLLETTVTCFTPNLSLAMRRLDFDGEDFLTVLASAMTEKLDHELLGNSSYIQAFKNGHLMDVLMQVVNTKVITVDVETVNFKLLKAMQAFLGAVTILDNAEKRQGFSETMLRAMDYALTRARQTGVAHDMIRTTNYSLSESYELLVNAISSLADHDETMFNLVKERIFA